jgi:SAM-dependent methyltransferase
MSDAAPALDSTHPVPLRPAQTLAYSLAIFLGAFLLFQVEPLIAKIVLPWFGGVASVWAVCLLFFQCVLLVGYLYAHLLTTRVAPRWQGWVHAGLLATSLAVLPILPNPMWKPSPETDPAGRILLILALTIGLPYLLLSATSPLLQAWFARRSQGDAPYRFYALSNAGSMLGLITYPVLVEPRVLTRTQAIGWSVAYAACAALCAGIALTAPHRATAEAGKEEIDDKPGRVTQVLWIALAACGSAMLLSVTNEISSNVAAVPFLWVLPLSLYLLTFIICFSGSRWVPHKFFLRLLVVALGGMTYALETQTVDIPLVYMVSIFCGGMFVCCMVLHGQLAKIKPAAARLTSYYLMISLGGAIGSVLVVLVAPHAFNAIYELPITIGACAVLVPVAMWHDRTSLLHGHFQMVTRLLATALALAIVVSLFVSERKQASGDRVAVRNFYGLLRVRDLRSDKVPVDDNGAPIGDLEYRELTNGTIQHGTQWHNERLRMIPTTYYASETGIGITLNALGVVRPLRVGVIGLGTGTIAAYGHPGDHYTFYEINPLDVEIAKNEFSYLRESPATIDIVMGDARLSLERQPPQQFDVLAVDAFSGDSIPTHLLTTEALRLYFRHINPGGILAVHISNRYLELEPVVQGAAARIGKACMTVDNADDEQTGQFAATWVLVSDLQTLLQNPEIKTAGKILVNAENERPWTDDYSSIYPLLRK